MIFYVLKNTLGYLRKDMPDCKSVRSGEFALFYTADINQALSFDSVSLLVKWLENHAQGKGQRRTQNEMTECGSHGGLKVVEVEEVQQPMLREVREL